MSDERPKNGQSLDELLAASKERPAMTPAEIQTQRISFAYGCLPSKSNLTREDVAARDYAQHGDIAAMEARIRADAKVIEAAEALASHYEKCVEELMSVYHSEFDGVWHQSEFDKVEGEYMPALSAFQRAKGGEI